MSFHRFDDRLTQANDPDAQRALLGELAAWRAQHLTDVPALREAAFAVSKLYASLNDNAGAQREAHALVSLCQTSPAASAEQLRDARSWLGALGGHAVTAGGQSVAGRSSRPARAEPVRAGDAKRGARERDRGLSLAQVAELVASGRTKKALEALDGRESDRSHLLATWARLRLALRARPDDQPRLLESLDADLAALLSPRVGSTAAASDAPRGASEPRAAKTDSELEALLGAAISPKRAGMLRQFDTFLAEKPEQTDALAAAALAHHFAHSGKDRPAPWLITYVTRALLQPASPLTRDQLNQLDRRSAIAVSAYHEPTFQQLLAILQTIVAQGFEITSVRRGILARGGEAADRRIWTARVSDGFSERMLSLSPPASEDLPADQAEALGARLAELSRAALLVAEGAGNASLCAAAQRHGVAIVGHVDPQAVLAALTGVEAAPLAAEPVRAPRAEPKAEAAPREPAAPRGPSLQELLTAQDMPSHDALVQAIGALRRVHYAFSDGERALTGHPQMQERLAVLLSAAHVAAPPEVRLSRGVTLAVSAAAQQPEGPVAACLMAGETAARYGGPGISEVIALAAAATTAGWTVDRALRGPTGRELRDDPVLQALDESPDGLWRLLLLRGEEHAELWFLGADTPETRAAVPRLLERDGRRVVVLPVEPALLDWYRQTGGPDPIGWMGSETAEVVEALR